MASTIKIIIDNEYFSIKDTLECGQVFRFKNYRSGYLLYSLDKCAYLYEENNHSVIECENRDEEYFRNYFDLLRDYSKIHLAAKNEGVEILSIAADLGKGIRILNQDKKETLFSFIVSQNNNIPRIKGIIEKLCVSLGEEKVFMGEKYYAFPSVTKMAAKDEEFYKSLGLGYRAEYVRRLAESIENGFDVDALTLLETPKLKEKLVSIHGVGPKVADCVTLFGFNKTDSFPVDTWIEKVYIENFKGNVKDRKKIAEWFTSRFKQNAGYYQQYLFYYKRSLEKTI